MDGLSRSISELRAQLNLTKTTKKEETTPAKHVLKPGTFSCCNVDKLSTLSSTLDEKRRLPRLKASDYAVADQTKMVRPVTAARLFNQKTTDRWESKKGHVCSLYLDELLNSKCVRFRHRVVAVHMSSLEKHPPKGSCHLDESQHESHTCSEIVIIELLMWNASYVQKTLQ